MNAQHWAAFFVVILSFNYSSAFFFGHYKGVDKGYDDDDSGYYGWSKGCSCHGRLTTRLDRVLKRMQSNIHHSYELMPQSLEEYQLKDGRAEGLNKFERKGPYRCGVTRDYARIIFRIGFFNLLIHYEISILHDILHTFMGGFASLMAQFFGEITDYAFAVAVPDFYISVVLRQDFGSNDGLHLEGFYPSNIDKLSFQDHHFGRHQESLTPYFRPVFDHVLRHFCQSELQDHFRHSFKTVSVDRDMFSYKHGGRYNNWSGYDQYNEGSTDGDNGSSEEESDQSNSRTYYSDDSNQGSYSQTYEVEDYDDSSID